MHVEMAEWSSALSVSAWPPGASSLCAVFLHNKNSSKVYCQDGISGFEQRPSDHHDVHLGIGWTGAALQPPILILRHGALKTARRACNQLALASARIAHQKVPVILAPHD